MENTTATPLVIDGFEIPTSPGAMVRLICGDTTVLDHAAMVGDIETCIDCRTDCMVVAVLPISVLSVTHL